MSWKWNTEYFFIETAFISSSYISHKISNEKFSKINSYDVS